MKFLLLFILSSSVYTLQYINMDENTVYDVEIIVFAYLNPLPDSASYTNKDLFDTSKAQIIEPLMNPGEEQNEEAESMLILSQETDARMDEEESENELKLFKVKDMDEEDSEMSIPLENETHIEALSGFEKSIDELKMTESWQILDNNPNTQPLIHKSWRITASDFNQPQQIHLSNLPEFNTPVSNEEEQMDEGSVREFVEPTEIMVMDEMGSENSDLGTENKPMDYQLVGTVSLSEGRYLHFGHKLNLIRLQETENVTTDLTELPLPEMQSKPVVKEFVFALDERKQIKPGELHYFDNPWIGSLVKVTEVEYTEENNEEEPLEDSNEN